MFRNFKVIIAALSVFGSAGLVTVTVYAEQGSGSQSGSSSNTQQVETERSKIESANSESEARKSSQEADKAKKAADKQASICARFDGTKIRGSISENENKLNDNRKGRGDSLGAKRSEIDIDRSSKRTTNDSVRLEHYTMLEDKAITPEQKAAVAEFKDTVEAAVTTRRAAQDSAKQAYREGVDAAIAEQQGIFDQDLADFKAATDAAVAKAKAACDAGTSVDSVRATLKTDLEAARASLKSARESDSVLKQKVEALKVVRKAAFDTAKNEFHLVLEEAKVKLEAALDTTSQ
jgi:hypothetical protein